VSKIAQRSRRIAGKFRGYGGGLTHGGGSHESTGTRTPFSNCHPALKVCEKPKMLTVRRTNGPRLQAKTYFRLLALLRSALQQ